ncbi:MAG: hypothetical protein A3E87_03810 [Gammaproteobacteria bacterium RIFCSPHIGHO2_12_FULL_35_23]|nr:MAG: hypothetical protein A3E87_03810 [Gammaproteobacteria bacterium RIFCSPHIGHO2_12_FULL_35_23]
MSSRRILLIEDELISRKVIADTLTHAGYSVMTCEGGKAALVELKKEPSDYRVIILDRLMPGMDGIQFLKLLQQEKLLENKAVIMLTTVKDNEAIVDALEAGVQEYLTKPVDPDQLLSLIRELISSQKIIK